MNKHTFLEPSLKRKKFQQKLLIILFFIIVSMVCGLYYFSENLKIKANFQTQQKQLEQLQNQILSTQKQTNDIKTLANKIQYTSNDFNIDTTLKIFDIVPNEVVLSNFYIDKYQIKIEAEILNQLDYEEDFVSYFKKNFIHVNIIDLKNYIKLNVKR